MDFLIFGDYSQGVTPLPISNRAVKTLNADGTARAAGWESRTLPKNLYKALDLPIRFRAFLLYLFTFMYGMVKLF